MTAPPMARPLCSDAELFRRLTDRQGVPLHSTDPRLPDLYAKGWIEPRGDRWRWNVRRDSPLTPELRAFIADDQAHVRRSDV